MAGTIHIHPYTYNIVHIYVCTFLLMFCSTIHYRFTNSYSWRRPRLRRWDHGYLFVCLYVCIYCTYIYTYVSRYILTSKYSNMNTERIFIFSLRILLVFFQLRSSVSHMFLGSMFQLKATNYCRNGRNLLPGKRNFFETRYWSLRYRALLRRHFCQIYFTFGSTVAHHKFLEKLGEFCQVRFRWFDLRHKKSD